jgi:predicted anti-sigma-YlaC factor YlaD
MSDADNADLACQVAVEWTTDYLEGALASARAVQLEQHLLICDACVRYLDQQRTVARALPQLGAAPPAAPNARERALEVFRRRGHGGGEQP